jgi:hypothetical protein
MLNATESIKIGDTFFSVWIWHKKNARQGTITVLVVKGQAERNDTATSMYGMPNHGCRLYHSLQIARR